MHLFLRTPICLATMLFLAIVVSPVHAQEEPNNAAPISDVPVPEKVSPSVTNLMKRYPPGTINSDERAVEALDAVGEERAATDQRLQKAMLECTKKFLVTKCRDEAKAQRRKDRQELKLIENEASRYQRQQKVIGRDQALADKRAQEEKDAVKREENRKKHDEKDAQRAAKSQTDTPRGASPMAGAAGKKTSNGLTKEQRAENVKKYQRKLAGIEEDRKKAAARKADNDRRRAAKRAKDAKEKSKAAAEKSKAADASQPGN